MRLRKSTKVDLLRSVPLFAGCSKTELDRIATAVDELALGAGSVLMREGERGREFVMIVDGTVDVAKGDAVVAQLGPGDFVGEIALVADVPRTATVTAATPVRVLVLTDRGFERLIDGQPSIARKVMATLGERLHQTTGG